MVNQHKKSHRHRRRERLRRHPGRASQMRADSRSSLPSHHPRSLAHLSPQERLTLQDNLDRSQPMPQQPQVFKLLNRASKGSYLKPRRLRILGDAPLLKRS